MPNDEFTANLCKSLAHKLLTNYRPPRMFAKSGTTATVMVECTVYSPDGETMNAETAGSCPEHEHEWCEIPLHEDARICAKCGEIREFILIPASEPDPLWPVAVSLEPASSGSN